MRDARFRFEPARYERELAAIIAEIEATPDLDARALDRILRRHPKDGRGFFAKSEILSGARHLARTARAPVDEAWLSGRLRTCPVRTRSGIAAVTVLTRPHPCPGQCVYCPSDTRMPRSYLASEPGAQRAATHRFDPYRQVQARLLAFQSMGHRLDKVELIVLGGTWSAYPEAYRIWFVTRCLEAMNHFGEGVDRSGASAGQAPGGFASLPDSARGAYNATVTRHLRQQLGGRLAGVGEAASWADLERAQRRNQVAAVRCVGLSLETRPDAIDPAEVVQLRRLGATRIQLGVQSVSDAVLQANRRGHDVAATRRAADLLRQAGFKLHAHWMPNLLGATPEADVEDFERLFADPSLRPDELKIYPCSLVESAELVDHHRVGKWRPYHDAELLHVVTECMRRTPRWCRLTRVVRDIPSTEILVGNQRTNFREVAERDLRRRGVRLVEIRSREIRDSGFALASLRLQDTAYDTARSREHFLEFVTPEDRIVAFLRLSLPRAASFVAELGDSAVIREVHVYGEVAGLGEAGGDRPQHSGLGRRLVRAAARRARAAGFASLAVISAVGTRPYYRRLGFGDGELYQHRELC